MSLAEQNQVTEPVPQAALPWGVRALAQELPDKRVSASLQTLANRLQRGDSWSESLRDPHVRLPPYMRGLLDAAIRTPQSAQTLEQFVHFHRRSSELRREMWLSVAYPLAVLVSLAVLFCCFEYFIVAELARIYEDFQRDFNVQRELNWPAVSLAMMAWSGPPALAVLLAILVVGIVLPVVWSLLRPRWLDVIAHRLPVLGPLWLWADTVDLCRLLSLLLEAGLPLPEAVDLTASGLRSSELAASCRAMANQVRQGKSLADAVSTTSPLPPTLAPIAQWGETRASLPQALQTAADMYEGRVRMQLDFVRLFLPPCAFLIAGGVILFSLMSIFYPLFHVLMSLT